MISAYCLGYQNWTVIPHQMEEDFKEMTDMGFDTVCLSFCESEMTYARRTFEIQIDLAHRAGLKVHVVPSRLGGRFAGAPLMPSIWLVKNPQYVIQDDWLPVACLEAEEVRQWFRDFMKTLISDYDLDGIVWDEPKAPALISRHPATVKRFGENPTPEDMMIGFREFFDDLTAYCRSLNPKLVQTLFCIKKEPEFFTSLMAKNDDITYFGYDGNLSQQRIFREDKSWRKYRIESAWERTLKECAAGGKKTFALLETMHIPDDELDAFEGNLEAYLSQYSPDHLSIYYYTHNADNPERQHAIVKRLMKKYCVTNTKREG